MKTDSSCLAARAEKHIFAYFRPTKKEIIVQKVERDSITIHESDSEEILKFGGVVEAGGRKVQVFGPESHV